MDTITERGKRGRKPRWSEERWGASRQRWLWMPDNLWKAAESIARARIVLAGGDKEASSPSQVIVEGFRDALERGVFAGRGSGNGDSGD